MKGTRLNDSRIPPWERVLGNKFILFSVQNCLVITCNLLEEGGISGGETVKKREVAR
jgi:hypothetical protein